MPASTLSDPPDLLPHGLPLRFRSLAVPDPGGRAGSDQLVDDLAHSVLDTLTLGGIRRLVKAAHGRLTGQTERSGKLLLGGIDGVVNQVNLQSRIVTKCIMLCSEARPSTSPKPNLFAPAD